MPFLGKLISSFSKNQVDIPLTVIEEIESSLGEESSDRSKLISATALLLGRVAFSDLEISLLEARRMEEILSEDIGLPKDQAEKLTKMAIEKAVLVHLEDHLVLREINQKADRKFKEGVLHALFHLAAVDDISGVENEAIRGISTSLGFSHADFIQIRSAYRDHLAVLKKS